MKIYDLFLIWKGNSGFSEKDINNFHQFMEQIRIHNNESSSKPKGLEKHDIGSDEQGSSSRSDQIV